VTALPPLDPALLAPGALLWPLLFGLGLYLLVTSQPIGRPKPSLGERLRRLDDAEADAEAAGDGERAALAREERQVLAEAVSRDFGLGGRSRRLGDPVERSRKTVSTRIRRAIGQVRAAHPELGRHLERSIDTGAWCAYRPADPVRWHL
jgi:hypothetical protein